MESIELIAIGVTALLGLFGFKKSNKKYSGVVEIVQRVNLLIMSITEAIKPDNDGSVRISTDELGRIKDELKQTKAVLEALGK
ncbi:hypothetical protein ACFL4T_03530 [candidate division KSB1 bacterium]